SETKEVPENKRECPAGAPICPSVHPSELVPSPISSLLAEPYKNRVQFSPTTIHFNTVTREDTGKYICEVVGDGSHIAKSEVNLIVQVPPSKPVAHVPTSATIGSKAVLRCTETDGSPPPTFRWYKDSMLMPTNPKTSLTFRNSSYTLDPVTGELIFEPLSGFDTGDYYCEAMNNVGSPQKSDQCLGCHWVLRVGTRRTLGSVTSSNTLAFSSTTGKKVIYSQPSHRSEVSTGWDGWVVTVPRGCVTSWRGV
uniref:Junctional adhesion molecule A n=1 Tax=Buteo japonicus TaxID=224669 RepID=A0A8C0AUI6_9AVES